jgi:transposase InsO family protein
VHVLLNLPLLLLPLALGACRPALLGFGVLTLLVELHQRRATKVETRMRACQQIGRSSPGGGDLCQSLVRVRLSLAVLLDLFSRKVVGWALRSHMRTELCLAALRQAITTRNPAPGLLHHTDRGSQYTSDDYQSALAAVGAIPSMSRKGNCWDNAVAESFFGTMEQELVGRESPWNDEQAARRAVGRYIHRFYNHPRRHSTIGNVSPVDYEAAGVAEKAEAA